MRVNMIELIPEREELLKLQKEYDAVLQQVAALQQENSYLERKLHSNSEGNLQIEETIFSDISNDNLEKKDSIIRNTFF